MRLGLKIYLQTFHNELKGRWHNEVSCVSASRTRRDCKLIKFLNNLNNFNGLATHAKAEWHKYTRTHAFKPINPLHATPRTISSLLHFAFASCLVSNWFIYKTCCMPQRLQLVAVAAPSLLFFGLSACLLLNLYTPTQPFDFTPNPFAFETQTRMFTYRLLRAQAATSGNLHICKRSHGR